MSQSTDEVPSNAHRDIEHTETKRQLVQGIGQVGGEVWRPYAQHSAKRRGEVRWRPVWCNVRYFIQ